MKVLIFKKKFLPDATKAIKAFFILGMICTACDTKIVETVKTLSVSESAMDFPSSGGENSFVVESNTNWSVDHNASSWLTATPNRGSDKGTVVVTTTANTGTVSRTAIITVSSTGLLNKTISVTQAGATPTLTVSVGSLSFASTAENKTFEITSNINWSIGSSESWLTVSPTTGVNNSPVSVSATENTGTTQRTATITVSGTGETSQTISVTQAGASSTLTLSTTSMSFSSISGQESFSITSNANWSVSSDQSWLSVSPTSGANNGTLTVTATENKDITQRTATITVVCSGVMTQTISVTQEGTSPSLYLSTTSLSFTSEAGQQSFNITSNTNWTIISDAPTWLTVSPSSGTNNGAVTVYAAANTGTTQRTATITISGTGVTSQTLNVTQERTLPSLQLSTNTMSFTSEAGQQLFNITSNTNWTVAHDAPTWLTVSPSSGANNGTVTVIASTNTGTTQRTATITVSGTGITPLTISVTQPGATESPTLTVSATSLSFTSNAESKTFDITSNINWTVSSNQSWLTFSPSSGANNGTVTVNAAANTGTTQRTATITVSGAGVTSQTINLTQSGSTESPTLTVSATSLSFTSIADNKTFDITSNINWTVSSSETWLTVSPSSGANNSTVTVNAAANTGTTQRTATITVSCEGVTPQSINVTQAGETPTLTVSQNSLSFTSEGQLHNFNINSNTEWIVSSNETWLTVSPATGANNGTVTVNVTANTGLTQRTATITVSGTDVTPKTISVTQAGAIPALTVSQNSLSFTSASQQRTFNVISNTNWTVSSDEPTWLTISPKTGANNGTVTVTASDNLSTTQRMATITVSTTDVTPQTISITQSGVTPILVLSTSSMNFSHESQQNTFTITSNTNWTIVSNATSWLTVEPSSGTNDGTVTVTVSSNTGTSQRTGFITVSGTDVTAQTISVIQTEPVVVRHVATAGTLSSLIAPNRKYEITDLILTGYLNGTDILYIREMSGHGYSDNTKTNGKLTNLNIEGANIVSGGNIYLSSLYSGNHVTSNNIFPSYMFYQCTTLKNIILPNSVTDIGNNAFHGCIGLTSVNIPNNVSSIGSFAFCGCSGITNLNIPNSVSLIGSFAFGGCSGLKSVNIPNNVSLIGSGAFSGCVGLISVNIPNSVSLLGSQSFSGCTNLTNIILGNSVSSIEDRAFYGCTSLKSISIPNSVVSMGDNIFEGCTGLTSVSIGNSVSSIGEAAFRGCTGITVVNIPNSVISIGEVAFYGCTGLTNINISNSVSSIGRFAFSYCTDLTSVNIPNSVTSIEVGAFYHCSGLTNIILGNSVNLIGSGVFSGCIKLAAIHSKNPTPPTIAGDTFDVSTKVSCKLYVPTGSYSSYWTQWGFSDITEE